MAAGASLGPGADWQAAVDGRALSEQRPRYGSPATPGSSASARAPPRPGALTSAARRRALGQGRGPTSAAFRVRAEVGPEGRS